MFLYVFNKYFLFSEMSRATKRKHVLMEVLQDDYSLPKENQDIVKVLSSRGNNLHEVETSQGETYLVSMPTKFRKNLWVKRGDFILVEPIAEGDKVKGEMVRLLTNEHIKDFKKAGVWPKEFDVCKTTEEGADGDLFVNTNRIRVEDEESDDESDTTESTTDSDSELDDTSEDK